MVGVILLKYITTRLVVLDMAENKRKGLSSRITNAISLQVVKSQNYVESLDEKCLKLVSKPYGAISYIGITNPGIAILTVGYSLLR